MKYLVVFSATALLCGTSFSFQTPVPPLKAVPYDPSWASEKWGADETPFLKVRQEVEAYVASHRISNVRTELFDRTRRAVEGARGSKSAAVLYRAACYTYMLAGLEITPEARKLVRKNEEGGWAVELGSIPSPHSREYDRLRFLMEGLLDKPFVDLGERLYQFSPTDREVAIKLAWIHCRYKPASRKRAVVIADQLLKTEDPERYPGVYEIYGLAHFMLYSDEPLKLHADRALWAFRKYLAAGPSWRPKAAEVNDRLEGFEKYLRDNQPH